MGKPRLPREIELTLPVDIVRLIYKYVPHLPKPHPLIPGLQRALESIQKSPKRNSMDLYGLDDFILC